MIAVCRLAGDPDGAGVPDYYCDCGDGEVRPSTPVPRVERSRLRDFSVPGQFHDVGSFVLIYLNQVRPSTYGAVGACRVRVHRRSSGHQIWRRSCLLIDYTTFSVSRQSETVRIHEIFTAGYCSLYLNPTSAGVAPSYPPSDTNIKELKKGRVLR